MLGAGCGQDEEIIKVEIDLIPIDHAVFTCVLIAENLVECSDEEATITSTRTANFRLLIAVRFPHFDLGYRSDYQVREETEKQRLLGEKCFISSPYSP